MNLGKLLSLVLLQLLNPWIERNDLNLSIKVLSWYSSYPTPVLLPGKSHGRRSLVGCSPWGRKESDTTEVTSLHFSLSCIGEGNGNPLQWSCLENPRDGGAWWAAIYGVAQSRTLLKWLSSSSRSGRSPWRWSGNPLQYSCLGNPMDRGVWWATVHRVAKELAAT